MRSMTGFGRGRAEAGANWVNVEIRTLNHKHFDLRLRTPWPDSELDEQISLRVRKSFARGAVQVQVTAHVTDQNGGAIDVQVARRYADSFVTLARHLGLDEKIPLELVVRQPGVVGTASEGSPDPAAQGLLSQALEQALTAVDMFRQQEGAALTLDLLRRVSRLTELLQGFSDQAGEASKRYRTRLAERIALLELPTIDPVRMAQEVAILAERSDVSEELSRLIVHLAEMQKMFTQAEPVGRKLDFLTQEIHREINTFAAKIQTSEGAMLAVEAKAELEKIREQIQNIQ